jgi:hypothetical protein
LRNDSKATVYVDIVGSGVARPPSAQKLIPGNVITAPWPPQEASILYFGDDPEKLQRFAIDRLCDMSRRNCDLRVSQLPVSKINGA